MRKCTIYQSGTDTWEPAICQLTKKKINVSLQLANKETIENIGNLISAKFQVINGRIQKKYTTVCVHEESNLTEYSVRKI